MAAARFLAASVAWAYGEAASSATGAAGWVRDAAVSVAVELHRTYLGAKADLDSLRSVVLDEVATGLAMIVVVQEDCMSV